MDTVYYKGKKYSAIRMPDSAEVKLYSLEGRYKGRYVDTVKENELEHRKAQDA